MKSSYILTPAVALSLLLASCNDKGSPDSSSSMHQELSEKLANISDKVDAQNLEIEQLKKQLILKDNQIAKLNEKLKKLEGVRIIKFPNAKLNLKKHQQNFADIQIIHAYGEFLRKLQLDDEKRTQLIKLIKNYQNTYSKKLLKMMKEEDKKVVALSSHKEIMKGSDEDKALQELLNEDYEKFLDYNKFKAFHQKVKSLNTTLDSKNKLDLKQQEMLVKLLHDISEKFSKTQLPEKNNLQTAKNFLNEAQLKALQDYMNKSISININGKKKTIRVGENIIITP
ncbi:MAG: hypothetical protein NE334_13590 [Lentisphaeraceae bacterium]|nr:hypothetical protein [Lentisphaeraceae bacterium]